MTSRRHVLWSIMKAYEFDGDVVLSEQVLVASLGDSLELVHCVQQLEKEFSIALPDSEVQHIKTVGNAIDLVLSKLNHETSPSPIVQTENI